MSRGCRRLACSLAAAALLLVAVPVAWGQELSINSSPNVVGSGARALGMGGAFIAVADDATAASWNPGGLTQLERPELSLVYNAKWLEEDFNSSSHPELSRDHSVAFDDINYFSFVYPIRRTIAGRNLVLSLNYQRKFDFDRDLDVWFSTARALPLGNIAKFFSKVKYSQRGALGTISPAFGFELTDKLSMGVVMNIWNQSLLPDNEWKTRREDRRYTSFNGMPSSWTRQQVDEDYEDFEGINYTFGLLYKPNERWSLGAVYHTKFTADVTYRQTIRTHVTFLPFPQFSRAKRDQEYVFPSAIGLGAAYRFPNDKMTLALDITRREWDQFIIHDPENTSRSKQRRSGVTGLSKDLSPHDPTYTVRLGMEYVFVDEKRPVQHYLPSLRAGVFYDPEPAGGRPNRWWGLGKYALGDVSGDVDDYWGIALGGGVLIKNRVNIDAAYVYRWGRDVRQDTFGLFGTDAGVDQHTFYISTVIYF